VKSQNYLVNVQLFEFSWASTSQNFIFSLAKFGVGVSVFVRLL